MQRVIRGQQEIDMNHTTNSLTSNEIMEIALILALDAARTSAAGLRAPHIDRLAARCRDLVDLPANITEPPPVSLSIAS